MRVVYVGNFKKPWCTEVHVASSLRTLGHQVAPLQEDHVNWSSLAEVVKKRSPDVFMWTRTWSAPDEAFDVLDDLRAAGIPSVFFHLDRWWGLDREHQITSQPCFRCDLVFTADGDHDDEWARVGVNHRWLPPGVFGEECLEVAPDLRRFPNDIVFVGSHPYPHPGWRPMRDRLIAALTQAYGERFRVWPVPGHPLRGYALTTLYHSATIVVGDSCWAGGSDAYWSDRVPETMGRGGFLIHPHSDTLAKWYPDLVTFPVGDTDAMLGEVERWLTHPIDREERRRANRALVLERDTYVERMRSVLDEVKRL